MPESPNVARQGWEIAIPPRVFLGAGGPFSRFFLPCVFLFWDDVDSHKYFIELPSKPHPNEGRRIHRFDAGL